MQPADPMSNVIPFPQRAPRRDFAGAAPVYDFTVAELDVLARWYSAMKYAFPGVAAHLCVNHESGNAWINLFSPAEGTTPKCLIFKHDFDGDIVFSCILGTGDRRGPFPHLTDVTAPQMTAIGLPADESWLDAAGWESVVARRTIHGVTPKAG
jgi:hypothetical protein